MGRPSLGLKGTSHSFLQSEQTALCVSRGPLFSYPPEKTILFLFFVVFAMTINYSTYYKKGPFAILYFLYLFGFKKDPLSPEWP